VYEYVSGGDLVRWLSARRARDGRGLTPAEVLELITQVAEALAFAHQRGLVHRDLKPANVLMEGGAIKLADFGIGGLAARQAGLGSRIGSVSGSRLSPAEQASLFRGAGTPLYMSKEQRDGETPDPRHDLYSLGVMWYQLLVGDVTREMGHGWAEELAEEHAVPAAQIELIKQCVGLLKRRPENAGKLLEMLRGLGGTGTTPATDAGQSQAAVLEALPASLPALASSSTPGSDRARRIRWVTRMRQLSKCHRRVAHFPYTGVWKQFLWVIGGLGLGAVVGGLAGEGLSTFKLRTWGWYNQPLGVLAGLVSGLAVLGVFLRMGSWFRRRHLDQIEQALAAKIDQVLAEFPQECQTWGGRAALADKDIVEEILRELEAPQP
jgi:hypothetical protein